MKYTTIVFLMGDFSFKLRTMCLKIMRNASAWELLRFLFRY